MSSPDKLNQQGEYDPYYEWNKVLLEFRVLIYRYSVYAKQVFRGIHDSELKRKKVVEAKTQFRAAKEYYRKLRKVRASQDPDQIKALEDTVDVEAIPLFEGLQTLQTLAEALKINIRGLKH